MGDLVALSLRQPWAWLVVEGLKPLENRRWNTKRRGPFLVHAAKGMTKDDYTQAVDFARSVDPTIAIPLPGDLDFGGIVGRARIVDVVPPCTTEPSLLWRPCEHPWHMGGQFGFRLDDVAKTPFVRCVGALGFFRVPGEVVAALGLPKDFG